MLSFSDLKKGAEIIYNGEPHEITEHSLMFKGRGHSTLTVRMKNLITGNVASTTFHPSDSFEEAEVDKVKAKFLFVHRDKFVFCKEADTSSRFELTESVIGAISKFLKPNQALEAIQFKGEIVNVILPIKISLKVVEAPPGVKGERAQAGTKQVTLETGAVVNTPLFIETNDVIEVNTENGEYVRRIE